MTKEFEALEKIGNLHSITKGCAISYIDEYKIIKQALLKAQEQEKELEVLQILKTKQVDINYFKTLIPYNETIEKLQSAYNMGFVQWAKLTLDETKIIKEWLENDK